MSPPALRAVSDLHVGMEANAALVDRITPRHRDDWLIVAGDIAEKADDIVRVLSVLRGRFAEVIWTPGNHELWTPPQDEAAGRGVSRYEHLVAQARSLAVWTPEDTPPVWSGPGGPVRVVPLFTLYDYSWHAPCASSAEESLAKAHEAGVICTDELLLHPDPYATRCAWSRARTVETRRKLDALGREMPWILVNHWPLLREPTRVMYHQEFVQWCGTEATATWHTDYPVQAVVYGHLHIPRTTVHDSVPFHEVSIGYPREWNRFGLRGDLARAIVGGTP